MKMKLYNAFGIKPTNTYVSAGSDYYVPNIKNDKELELAMLAFEKSYGISKEDLNYLRDLISVLENTNLNKYDVVNALHLFLATYNPDLEDLKNSDLREAVFYFFSEMLVIDPNSQVLGVKLCVGDTLFVNSGIKVALDTVLTEASSRDQGFEIIQNFRKIGIGIAGLYVNKSGKGNSGYDVRACLVDEDYAGYVHLSMAYTKDNLDENKAIVYCGDKLTQMMLVPVFHTQYEEVSEEEYLKIMSNSKRGDNGFGSSDIKH